MSTPESPVPSPVGRTALVVDDDPAVRQLIATTLELEGWTVEVAIDGDAAIEALIDRRPDLVVLDMMMPGASGLEVLQAMHAHPQLYRVPSIICSAREPGLEQEVAEAFGAHTWLVKPIEPDDLLAAIDEALAD